jgi:hypothetical protein
MKMTSLIVQPLALVVLSLIASELLWLDQSVEEIGVQSQSLDTSLVASHPQQAAILASSNSTLHNP